MKFKDEWKLLSMKNFINNMYGGASITPSDYQNDGVPTVPKSAINSSGIADLSNSKFVSDDYCQKNLNSCVYSGDFVTSLRDLVPTAPNMGRVVKLIGESKRYLMPQGVYRLLLEKNIDENFLIAFSNSDKFRNSILKIKTGSTQVHIRNSQYLGIEIIAPSHEEQMKIGNFFKSLDDTISLHQQELEALKQTKQGFLQKMFPKNKDTVPEIRFPGFQDAWNEYKLGDLMKVTSVKRIHQSDWTDSGVRFLRARDIVSTFNRKRTDDYLYISKEKYQQYSLISGKVAKNDVLVTGVGSIGVPMLITDDNPVYFKDGNIIWFKNEDKINGYFLYYSFVGSRIQKFIKNIAGIGTVGTYTIDSGKKTPILLPSKEEQIKIGEFFRQLDEVIELKEKELDALKETKKGFLQKMFV